MSKPILDNLFGSKVRVKLLKFLYRNHPGEFTMGELARRVQESPTETKREIELLRELDIIKKR